MQIQPLDNISDLTELTVDAAVEVAGVHHRTMYLWARNIPGLARREPRPDGPPRWMINTAKLMEVIARRERATVRDQLPYGTLNARPRPLPATGKPVRPPPPRFPPPPLPEPPKRPWGMTATQAAKVFGHAYDTIARWARYIPGVQIRVPGRTELMVDPIMLAVVDNFRQWRKMPRGCLTHPQKRERFIREVRAFAVQFCEEMNEDLNTLAGRGSGRLYYPPTADFSENDIAFLWRSELFRQIHRGQPPGPPPDSPTRLSLRGRSGNED